MYLYNTLTRRIEKFKPLNPPKVTFYHCGPTVYWVQHIGNLRAMVLGDLIRRSLIYLGYKVIYVRNYTDVGHLTSDQDFGEDKMEKGAKREKLTPQQLAEKYIKIFEKDTKALNILEPDYKPRATEYIKEMQKMTQILLNKGYAYLTSLAVVFDVSKFKNYNQLNRQKLDLNRPGLGRGEIDDPEKKHSADFNLWVFKKGPHKNALQTWPSPWGEGFPGWHIECSVMAKELLGKTIDIHMGGVEHIPIHHTNEIAQSEAANGVKFVKYWLHNEHLTFEGKKMAKSEGTALTLKEIINKGFNPLSLRYFYLNAHYRSKQNFTFKALKSSETAYQKLKETVLRLRQETNKLPTTVKLSTRAQSYQRKFAQFILNDFQIPKALALTWEMLKSNISPANKLSLLLKFDQVLGLNLSRIKSKTIPQLVVKLANQRQLARQKKDFKRADQLRKTIKKLGYYIEDEKDGFKIRPLKK